MQPEYIKQHPLNRLINLSIFCDNWQVGQICTGEGETWAAQSYSPQHHSNSGTISHRAQEVAPTSCRSREAARSVLMLKASLDAKGASIPLSWVNPPASTISQLNCWCKTWKVLYWASKPDTEHQIRWRRPPKFSSPPGPGPPPVLPSLPWNTSPALPPLSPHLPVWQPGLLQWHWWGIADLPAGSAYCEAP